jgi:hypothetical protein
MPLSIASPMAWASSWKMATVSILNKEKAMMVFSLGGNYNLKRIAHIFVLRAHYGVSYVKQLIIKTIYVYESIERNLKQS